EIARRRPTHPEQLEVLRGFPQARNPRIIGQILKLVEDVRRTPASQWPQPAESREETPMMRVTLDILSAFMRATCVDEQLDHDLVGSTQRLRDLLDFLQGHAAERPALLSGWRQAFIGQRLVDLLEGRCELHLSGFPDALHLEVVTHATKTKRAASAEKS